MIWKLISYISLLHMTSCLASGYKFTIFYDRDLLDQKSEDNNFYIKKPQLHEDGAEYADQFNPEGRTVTPAPVQGHKRLYPQARPILVQQGRPKPGLKLWQIKRESADEKLKSRLMVMLRESMAELEWSNRWLKTFYTDNKHVMKDMKRLVGYADQAYKDSAVLYKRLHKNQDTLHPLQILNAFEKLRKGNTMMSSILNLLRDKIAIKKRVASNDRVASIAWSYYDEDLE